MGGSTESVPIVALDILSYQSWYQSSLQGSGFSNRDLKLGFVILKSPPFFPGI